MFSFRGGLYGGLRLLARGVARLCEGLLVAWGALALYAPVPWNGVRLLLAIGFAATGVWALWLGRTRWRVLAFAALFIGVVVWWLMMASSHEGGWRPEGAVMPALPL